MKLGARIRELRHGANMTQQQLAEQCDMTQVDISRIEAGLGKHGPTYVTLMKLSQALKQDVVPHYPLNDATVQDNSFDVAAKV